MPAISPLTESDVRQIVSILGNVAAMPPDPDVQRIYLMGELANLLGADTWVWCVAPLLDPEKQPVYLDHHTGGMGEARMTRFLKAVEHPDCAKMTAPLAQALISAGSQVAADSSSTSSSEASPARRSPASPKATAGIINWTAEFIPAFIHSSGMERR